MKLGYVGFGKSANRYHLPFADLSNTFDIVGYYSKGDSKFTDFYPLKSEFKRYDTLEELLEVVDVVSINTPVMHFELAKEAIKAGKHVLIEKPMCNTLAEVTELYDLAKEYNVKITPYQNRRFDSDFLTIKHIIENEDIGEVMEITTAHTQYRMDYVDFKGPRHAGHVMGHAVHFVDQIVSFYGEPDDVKYDITNQKNYYFGNGESFGEEGIIDDYYNIILIYGNKRIIIKYSQFVAKEQPRWIVNATNATVEKYFIDQQERDLKAGYFPNTKEDFGVDLPNTKATIYKVNGTDLMQASTTTKQIETVYGGYHLFYKKFYNALKNGGELPVTEFEAKVVLNILQTIVDGLQYKKLIGKQ